MLYAKKGEIIKCPNCEVEVYKWAKNVSYGDPHEASQVKGINGYPDPQNGDEMKCPNCGQWGLFPI